MGPRLVTRAARKAAAGVRRRAPAQRRVSGWEPRGCRGVLRGCRVEFRSAAARGGSALGPAPAAAPTPLPGRHRGERIGFGRAGVRWLL